MLKRETTQKIEFLDTDRGIICEKTTVKWKLFGITYKKRTLELESILPSGETSKKIGFSK